MRLAARIVRPTYYPPPGARQIRSDGVYSCLTAHYHKVSPRDLLKGFKEQAIMTIKMITPPPKRYVLGRTNHGGEDGKYGTSKFHVNPYFNTVTAIQMSNRRQLIAEIWIEPKR